MPRIGLLNMVGALVLCWIAGAAARAAEPPADLAAYMDDLARLRARWQVAAQLFHDGKKSEAAAIYGRYPYEDVPARYRDSHHGLAQNLRNVRDTTKNPNVWIPSCVWYAQNQADDLAAEAFAARHAAGLAISTQEAALWAESLVALRRYSEALAAMEEGLREPTDRGAAEALEAKRKLLGLMRDGEEPGLDFLREYYLVAPPGHCERRLWPVLAVWQAMADGRDVPKKAALLAELFTRYDNVGQRLVAEHLAARPGVPDDVAADAWVNCGCFASGARQPEEALRRWREVEARYPGTDAWPKAVYNIGLVLKERERLEEAIGQFRKILAARVNDREPGGSIMEPYRNYSNVTANQISQCYEAMGRDREAFHWAWRAETRYPYGSWCGTCLEQHASAANRRLWRLGLAAYWPATLVALGLVAGLLARRRRRRARAA